MISKVAWVMSAMLLVSNTAFADHRYHNKHHKQHMYEYAKVTSVTPIIKSYERKIPQRCDHSSHYSYDKSNYKIHDGYRGSSTPMILGTIIGAAIGNELGHNKTNKKVGAVAGGILGASIGSDINRKHHKHYPRHSYSKHSCDDLYTVEYHEKVVGYDVSYRYRGNVYQTQTPTHPGDRIQLRVQFEPMQY